MEEVPGEHGARVVEIEIDFMARRLDLVHGLEVALVAELGRDMVIEQDDVPRDPREFSQLTVVDRNVDEYHQRAFEFIEREQVVVGPRVVSRVLAPCLSHGPDRTKTVRTAGVIKTDLIHETTIPD